MKINPEKLAWSAPTEDVAGNEITEPLSYTLGISDGSAFVETLSFPGTLNTDGKYSVPFADLALSDGAHTLALRAFYQDSPDLRSEWSNSVQVMLGAAEPKAPFGLAAI